MIVLLGDAALITTGCTALALLCILAVAYVFAPDVEAQQP